MTLTLVILVLAVVVVGTFIIKRGGPRPVETLEEKSDWTMFTWIDESGHKTLLQSRDERPSDLRNGFATAVVMEWRYGMEGLPDQPTMNSIYQFEDALEAIRNDKTAVHVHTLTGNGIREWCYYTANFTEFESRFNELVSPLPKMPIEISYQADQDWLYWQKLKSTVRGHGA